MRDVLPAISTAIPPPLDVGKVGAQHHERTGLPTPLSARYRSQHANQNGLNSPEVRVKMEHDTLVRAIMSAKSLFIGNIPGTIKDWEVKDITSRFGKVVYLFLPHNATPKETTYAFVEFETHVQACHCFEALQDFYVDDRRVNVDWDFSARRYILNVIPPVRSRSPRRDSPVREQFPREGNRDRKRNKRRNRNNRNWNNNNNNNNAGRQDNNMDVDMERGRSRTRSPSESRSRSRTRSRSYSSASDSASSYRSRSRSNTPNA